MITLHLFSRAYANPDVVEVAPEHVAALVETLVQVPQPAPSDQYDYIPATIVYLDNSMSFTVRERLQVVAASVLVGGNVTEV